MSDHTSIHGDDIEPAGPGGAVRFVRRALDVTAFGINELRLPANFEGPEHDETRSGQEEVYVVVSGGGALVVDGEAIDLRPGVYVRVGPAARRQTKAGPDGLVVVAVGAPVDGRYEPRGPF